MPIDLRRIRIAPAAKTAGVFDNPIGQGLGRGLNWALGQNASSGSDAVLNGINSGTRGVARGLARGGLAALDGFDAGVGRAVNMGRGALAFGAGAVTAVPAAAAAIGSDSRSFAPNYLHGQALPMMGAGLRDVFSLGSPDSAVDAFNADNSDYLRAAGQGGVADVGEWADDIGRFTGGLAAGGLATAGLGGGLNAMRTGMGVRNVAGGVAQGMKSQVQTLSRLPRAVATGVKAQAQNLSRSPWGGGVAPGTAAAPEAAAATAAQAAAAPGMAAPAASQAAAAPGMAAPAASQAAAAPGMAGRVAGLAKGVARPVGGAAAMSVGGDVVRAVADEPESDPALAGAVEEPEIPEGGPGGDAAYAELEPQPQAPPDAQPQAAPAGPQAADPRAGIAASIQAPEFQRAFHAASPEQQQEMLRPVVDELMPHAEALSGQERKALMDHVMSDGKLTFEDVQYLATTTDAGREMLLKNQEAGVQNPMNVFETIGNMSGGEQAMMFMGVGLPLLAGLSSLLGGSGIGTFLLALLGGGGLAGLAYSGYGKGVLDWLGGMMGGDGGQPSQPGGGGATKPTASAADGGLADLTGSLDDFLDAMDPNSPRTQEAQRALAAKEYGPLGAAYAGFRNLTGGDEWNRQDILEGARKKLPSWADVGKMQQAITYLAGEGQR